MFGSLRSIAVLAAAVLPAVHAAGVTGSAEGFAASVTGGGSAAGAYPADIAQLKSWLEDSTPRVILINKEYNFIGSEGTCTNCAGCIPSSQTCGASGQYAISPAGLTWCDGYPSYAVTYDTAGTTPINVGSNKSLVGVGSGAVIRGKGLAIKNGAQNVIIQNIHFTQINPEYIWGGDAITLDGTNLVWIDHNKISLVGRQFFVTGYEASNLVSVTNNEFDGTTSWSAACNGRHYWAILGLGDSDLITFKGNYVHSTSGRSPKIGYNSVWHTVNNYFNDIAGHAFDVDEGANALIEGNVFNGVTTPILGNSGQIFVPTSSTVGTCAASMGRNCVVNTVTNSGGLSANQPAFLVNLQGKSVASAAAVSGVQSSVLSHAGVGKI